MTSSKYVKYGGSSLQARFFNEPLMAALDDKLMVGATVALDDPYQAEVLPHARRHYGQILFADIKEILGDTKSQKNSQKTHFERNLRL